MIPPAPETKVCKRCQRSIAAHSDACVCANLIPRSEFVSVYRGGYSVKCADCRHWVSVDTPDRFAVVDFTCMHCKAVGGGRLDGEIVEACVIPITPVDTSWIGRSDGFEEQHG